MAIDFVGDYKKALTNYNKQYGDWSNNYNGLANIYNSQREDYLGKYGDYLDLVDAYNAKVQDYYNKVDAYNALAQQEFDKYKASIDAYNSSIIQDASAYPDWRDYNYTGEGPYTTYNGKTVGRTNPTEQYQLSPEEMKKYGMQSGYTYDEDGNQIPLSSEAIAGTDYYISPTGMYYGFASRPAAQFSPSQAAPTFSEKTPEFSAVAPTWTEPEAFNLTAPVAPKNLPAAGSTLGNIPQQDLYQQLFGRGTLDTLSNEAWSLANIASPFTTSEENAYETGNMTNINNPYGYVSPDALTTGEGAKDYGAVQSPFL